MLFGQLLLLCVWELGLRQFCRLFYSAIPQKGSSNLTQLLVILLFYTHHSILSNMLGFGATFFGSETRGPFHLRFPLGGLLVDWFGFSFVCNISEVGDFRQSNKETTHELGPASLEFASESYSTSFV